MAEIERRRRRPAVSCTLCRKRKIKCNRETPCNNCIKSKSGTCVYENNKFPPRGNSSLRTLQPSTASTTESPRPSDSASLTSDDPKTYSFSTASIRKVYTSLSSVANQPSAQEVEALEDRIRQLESQLRQHSLQDSSSPSRIDISFQVPSSIHSGLGEGYFIHGELDGSAEPKLVSRYVSHKTRLFGQSHWVNTIVLLEELFNIIEKDCRKGSQALIASLNTCKQLARMIKVSRKPPWPLVPTTELPPKTVADELLDCYLRTVEPVYRILHIPTLKRDYDAIWASDTTPDMSFLIQLKLIFAIGATTYDESFSLKSSAIQWVYEAITWLSEPVFKPRLQIQYLQTDILLLLAREMTDVGSELLWISAGSLIRKAMYMGLHRDPTALPKMTLYAAEMRRRLWNTILEICLRESLTSGGLPLISLDDFDTQPPSNFDDEQLMADQPIPKPVNEFTQMSVARVLRSTMPTRVAVVKFLNNTKSASTSYAETLRLDSELRNAQRSVRQAFMQFKRKHDLDEQCIVNFLLRRYLSALHIPFFGPALKDTAYAFSRKVVAETSLSLWRTVFPEPITPAFGDANKAVSPMMQTLQRLTVNTTGMYSTVLFQAAILIAVELKSTLLEDDGLNPLPMRRDLYSVLQEAKEWSLMAIKNGETSVKGYLVACLLDRYLNALMEGSEKEMMVKSIIQEAERCLEICLPILEAAVARGQQNANAQELLPDSWDMLMTPDAFQHDTGDPMSWILNENNFFM